MRRKSTAPFGSGFLNRSALRRAKRWRLLSAELVKHRQNLSRSPLDQVARGEVARAMHGMHQTIDRYHPLLVGACRGVLIAELYKGRSRVRTKQILVFEARVERTGGYRPLTSWTALQTVRGLAYPRHPELGPAQGAGESRVADHDHIPTPRSEPEANFVQQVVVLDAHCIASI
jgi:hypothetical protein